MPLRKKILSYFLFTTYLLVVLHQSVAHQHSSEIAGTSLLEPSHQHENFETVHHEHHFHIGLFHFWGHLFENVNHQDDRGDEHLTFFQNLPTKKVADSYKQPLCYSPLISQIFFRVDPESLTDPPFHLSFLQKLSPPGIPLRAPPSIV